jgi:hypothetical protein
MLTLRLAEQETELFEMQKNLTSAIAFYELLKLII